MDEGFQIPISFEIKPGLAGGSWSLELKCGPAEAQARIPFFE
jgi:hypothetical protein